MTDLFLDGLRDELAARRNELEPIIEEYDRIGDALYRLGSSGVVLPGESLKDRLAGLVRQNPGTTTMGLAVGVSHRRVLKLLEELELDGVVEAVRVHKKATKWYPADEEQAA